MGKNHYETLEINSNASFQEIKKSYRKLALIWHPDKNSKSNAAEIFIRIHEAYEVLRNKESRDEYDKKYTKTYKSDVEQNYHGNTSNADYRQAKGKEKGEYYMKMDYDKFTLSLFEELGIAISYTPSIFLIGLSIFMVIGSFSIMVETSFLIGIFSLLFFGVIGYFLFDRAKKDFIAERIHKITKLNN